MPRLHLVPHLSVSVGCENIREKHQDTKRSVRFAPILWQSRSCRQNPSVDRTLAIARDEISPARRTMEGEKSKGSFLTSEKKSRMADDANKKSSTRTRTVRCFAVERSTRRAVTFRERSVYERAVGRRNRENGTNTRPALRVNRRPCVTGVISTALCLERIF